jgi:hypothetical protein
MKRPADGAGFNFPGDAASTCSGGSDFSLVDEAARQAGGGAPVAKRTKHTIGDGQCANCEDPIARGQIRCWKHKRAFECLHKNIMKGGDAAEIAIFEETFGKSKGDIGCVEKQNVVFNAFLEQNPDGQLTKGKPRGKGFRLASVVHSTGFRIEKANVQDDRMWDLELFTNKMKSSRGWSAERAKTEFDILRASPNLESDMGGPRWSRERVQVPAHLLGKVSKVTKEMAFEERRLDQSTKPTALSKTAVAPYAHAPYLRGRRYCPEATNKYSKSTVRAVKNS